MLDNATNQLAAVSRLKLTGASDEFLALVEDMPESPTGLGVRTPYGKVFQIIYIHHNIRCEGTVTVDGPSFSEPFEISFTLDFDRNDTDIDFDYAPMNSSFAQFLCYRALANNQNLTGRIRPGSGYEVHYAWRNRTIPMMPSMTRQLFFVRNPDEQYSPKTCLFNPATVTPAELDFALAKLFEVELLSGEMLPPDEDIPTECKKYEMTSAPIDVIADNSLNQPRFVEGKYGTIAYGTDKGIGYNPWNEDAVVVNSEKGFAVIDGLGGHEGGQEAAGLLAIEFKQGFRKNKSFADIHHEAHYAMQRAKIDRGGACYIGAKIDNGQLHVGQAGDVKLMVIGVDGTIKFVTQDERRRQFFNGKMREGLVNVASGSMHSRGHATLSDTPLSVGDRIVTGTDGLFDNIPPEEVVTLIHGKTIQEAIQILNMTAKERMRAFKECKDQKLPTPPNTKPDNIGVVVYDIENSE